MNAKEALKKLEALGTDQNRKVYARHGVRPPAFGVSYAGQRQLAKEIGRDAEVARALWASGNHDARVLATMVADPAALSRKELEAMAKDLANYVLTDAFSTVVADGPHAHALATKWIRSQDEWVSSAGWNVLCRLASGEHAFAAGELEDLLETIEGAIHDAPNRTRYAMNGALIAIGTRGGALEKAAVAAARRIGAVDVDHGETGCKTPDAVTYIPKAAAHRAGKAAKAGARKAAKKKAKKTASRR